MVARTVLKLLPVLLLAIGAASAKAEDTPVQWVGRVSAVDGDLSIRAAGGDWTDSAVINDPVAPGMSVRTAAQSRAILRIGPETIALAPSSELSIGELDASGTQLTLRQGRIGIRLSSSEPANSIEVEAPGSSVWLLASGEYDITAGDDHTATRVATFDGRARLVGKGIDRVVVSGGAALVSTAEPATATADSAATDDFDSWWRATKSAANADPAALGHISPEMTGYEMLDASGSWETRPGIGTVWLPTTVPADWAPYRYGHWRFVSPAGWTWVDDMEWGFAPSHYGRWAKVAGSNADAARWAWMPGAFVQHPSYMPAAVAFIGTAGVGISCPDGVGAGVGWFPLGPGEPYWPGTKADADTIRRLNAGTGVDLGTLAAGERNEPPAAVINTDYHNRTFASVVPRAAFLAGKSVEPALVTLPERRLQNAPVLAGSPQLPPVPAASLVASTAPGRTIAGAVQVLARVLAPRPAALAAASLVRVAPARQAFVAAVARRQREVAAAHSAPPRFVVLAAARYAREHIRVAAAVHRGR
ncbi:MAG: hypothetical protein JO001_24660 [Alphaproteobacteria bacterium]|nr:hypothetical protein [Alphaproteobacteria bacterium]